MKKTKVVELSLDKDISKELEKLKKEGWRIVAKEPIEKIITKIVGSRFTLEKRD